MTKTKTKAKKPATLSFALSQDLADAVQAAALQGDCSVATVLRQCVRETLTRAGVLPAVAQPTPESLTTEAADLTTLLGSV